MLLVVLRRLRYPLSLRHPAEISLGRGLALSHEAVRTWQAPVAPLPTEQLRARRKGTAGPGWHADETCIRVHGGWCHLYRAFDAGGKLIDPVLSGRRDMGAGYPRAGVAASPARHG